MTNDLKRNFVVRKEAQKIVDEVASEEVPAFFGDCKYCEEPYCEGECQWGSDECFPVDLASEIARKEKGK